MYNFASELHAYYDSFAYEEDYEIFGYFFKNGKRKIFMQKVHESANRYAHEISRIIFESGKALHHRPGGNQEDSEVIGLRQAGKLRLENIQWDELEQGEQQGRVHHLGTGKREAEYGKLIPQGTSYQ